MLSELTSSSMFHAVSGFFQAVISIFAIVNPVGNLPVFLGLTEDATLQERRRVFRLASLVALGIIVVMALVGNVLLHSVFHISLDEFRFAGGLLLIVVGTMRIVERPGRKDTASTDPAQREHEHTQLAVSPLASPLLVGPGTIVVVMLIVNRSGPLYALSASLVAFSMVWAILNWGHLTYRIMGRVGSMAVGRVMHIFIVAIGVHFIFDVIVRVFLQGNWAR